MRSLDFNRLLRPLKAKVYRIIGKAIVKAIDNSNSAQKLQITVLKNETVTDIERVQEYGLDTYPKADSQAIILSLNGNRENGVVINVSDRRYRLTNLSEGEVAIYTYEDANAGGHRIHLKSGQEIEINCDTLDVNATTEINLDGGTGSATGIVTGQCICSFTGGPHPDVSTNVKASK